MCNFLSDNNTAICLGSFDGLHRGHKAVIANAGAYKPILLSFDPHPVEFFTNKKPPFILQDDLKAEMLKKMNVELVRLDFSKLFCMSAEDFFYKIIIERYNASAVSCGYNYRFGSGASGDTVLLKKLCDKVGIPLFVANKICYNGEAVSSTRIRAAIADGDIISANEMLGYKFTYRTEVIHGNNRGSTVFGFPTANQLLPKGLALPVYGVYKSEALIGGKALPSITNIGIRPTIGGDKFFSETHIINFNKNIYGKLLQINLIDFIRPEKKFSSLEELKKQIKSDIGFAVTAV